MAGREGRLPDRATVLVVDDSADMRDLLRDFLEHEGYRVLVASGAADATAVAGVEAPDVAILDKEMPGMNGLELLTVFRDQYPKMPVIVITAFGGPDVGVDALERGAAFYFDKPVRVMRILEALQDVMR